MKIKFIFLFILCFILVGCSTGIEKKSTDKDTFTNILTNNNFTVTESNEYSDKDYIIFEEIAKYNDNNNFVIEMVKYDSEENANKVFKNHIKSFSSVKSTGAHSEKENGKNYEKYVLISNNMYMITSRIDDTLIFCKAKLDYKDTIINIFNELGY